MFLKQWLDFKMCSKVSFKSKETSSFNIKILILCLTFVTWPLTVFCPQRKRHWSSFFKNALICKKKSCHALPAGVPSESPHADSATMFLSELNRSESWPVLFVVPTFRHNIAFKIQTGDKNFEEDDHDQGCQG